MCAFRGCERREICWGRNCCVQPLRLVNLSFFDFFFPRVFSCVTLDGLGERFNTGSARDVVDEPSWLVVVPREPAGSAVGKVEEEVVGFLV